jgi:hypothetical protein
LNPVIYVQPKSQFSHLIEPALIHIFENDKLGDPRIRYSASDINEQIVQITPEHVGERKINTDILIAQISFIKNHKGDVPRYKKSTIKDYRFYDEREWRYIPTEEEFIKNFNKPYLLMNGDVLRRKNRLLKVFLWILMLMMLITS